MSVYLFDETYRMFAAAILGISELKSPPRIPDDGNFSLGGLSHREEDILAIRICQILDNLKPHEWKEGKAQVRIGHMRDALLKLGYKLPISPVLKHRSRVVQIGQQNINLTNAQGCVLQALIELGHAEGDELATKSGHKEAARILRELVQAEPELEPFIYLPGSGRGTTGYSTVITLAS